MKKTQLMVSLLLLVLLLVACAPKAAPAPAPQAPAPAPAPALAPAATVPTAPVIPAWQATWEKMVENAKKEGSVVAFSALGAEVRAALQRAFKANYDIGLEFIAGTTGEMGAKILAERRAGLRLSDIGLVSSNTPIVVLKPADAMEPLDGVLILPEFSDPKLWWGGEMQWSDPKTHTTLVFSKYVLEHIAINTELVKPAEIQSFNDLLNPKWKGKILMRDPTKLGAGLTAIAMPGRYTMGWDWVRALAKQEPLLLTDVRQQMEWVARGKYPIAFGYQSSELFAFQQLGMPVSTVHVREGGYIVSGQAVVNLLKGAPHPNAAKLFINWLLTREGQTVFSQANGTPSTRLDVSDKGLIYPLAPPKGKVPEADSEEAILNKDEDMKIIKEIFGPLLRGK